MLALNSVDARHRSAFETEERGNLCEYVENLLEEAGLDVDALAARHRLTSARLPC
jgi:hypothetical protein